MATHGRAKDAGARMEREITLKDAAELTGCSGKVLRRLIREGRLRPMSMEGNRMTVSLAALREAGLLPALAPEGRGVSPAPPVADDGAAEAEEAAAEAEARASTERAAREAAEAQRLEQERAARQRAEAERLERERAAKDRAERDRAEADRLARERAEKEREALERLELERAERERAEQAEKVVPMHRIRPAEDDPASEGVEDAADADDFDGDADPLGDADDAPDPSREGEERETVRILPAEDDPEPPRLETLEGEVQPRLGSSSLMVTGAPSGPFITAAQIHELLRLLLSEREAKSNEWQERAENLYREIIESQKARIAQLEREKQELEEKSSAQVRDVQGRLEGTLRMVPQGVDLASLEQLNRDLRIELERREVQKSELERERDRLRDLVERLKNDLSRSERRNLDLAETLRKLRAMGPVDRFLGREPD